jgi:hypothetical protein
MRSPAHSLWFCADRHESYLPLALYLTQNGDGQRKWGGSARKAAHPARRQLPPAGVRGAFSTRGTDSIGERRPGIWAGAPLASRRTRFAPRPPPWVAARPRRTSRLRGDASRTRPTLRRALFPPAVLPLRGARSPETRGRGASAHRRRRDRAHPPPLRRRLSPTTHLPLRWTCCTSTSRHARGA